MSEREEQTQGAENDAESAPYPELATATIDDLQRAMSEGSLSARALAEHCLARIAALDATGPALHAMIEVNPDALAIAEALDRERAEGRIRGPLHGIPVLLKDNIGTTDRMQTTAGSLALVGARPPVEAPIVEKLRAAGAIILGKTNLSEWANFRGEHSSSGWSGRGGQCRNPHALDRSPIGSSSGSGAAVAAGYVPLAIGTETDGSILGPSSANGVVGLKPTLGLLSRTGIVPIAHSQDTAGPMTRTVREAAIALGLLTGVDPHDPASAASAGHALTDYTRFLSRDALRGARIGVARETYFGYSRAADAVAEAALDVLRAAGAVLVDPANIPTAKALGEGPDEFTVLLYEFKADLDAYLAALGPEAPVHALADVIAFNEAHADAELRYFGQELMLQAQAKGPLTEEAYLKALETSKRLAGPEGIDAVMDAHNLDALVMPTMSPAWAIDLVNGDHAMGGSAQPAAVAGYPSISVPAGQAFGLPVGLTFLGRAWSEAKLLALAYAFEQAAAAYRVPTFRTRAIAF